jgi:hypothetical protein
MRKYATADRYRRDCNIGKVSQNDVTIRCGAQPSTRIVPAHDFVVPGNDGKSGPYLSLIGGAVFSAGAGGNTGGAPAFRASASGRAGSGGTPDGLVPVVVGSDGADGFVSAPGVDCSGGVACAICSGLRALIWVSERADMTSPIATSAEANSNSFL